MSKLKHRRPFHASARLAAPGRIQSRTHASLRHRHSGGDDEFRSVISNRLRITVVRVPVVSTVTDVSRMVEVAGADAVAGRVPGGSNYIRELGWNLEATGTELVLASSLNNVLFRQTRAGRNGIPFHLLKFRSMVPTAENDLESLRQLNEGAGPLFEIRSNPRVTRCGRWMRQYSMDELPQFWNVLFGEMSLVGAKAAAAHRSRMLREIHQPPAAD